MDKLTKFAGLNINIRDKILKVLQYGSRFLIGYYGSNLTEEGGEKLQYSIRTILSIRRACRLCFFFNNITNMITKVKKIQNSQDSVINIQDTRLLSNEDYFIVEFIDILEQAFRVRLFRSIITSTKIMTP